MVRANLIGNTFLAGHSSPQPGVVPALAFDISALYRSWVRSQRRLDPAMAQNVNGNGQDKGDRQGPGRGTARGGEQAEDAALQARLKTLSNALDARREQSDENESQKSDRSGQELGKAINLGFRVLAEFVAAIVVGTLIGWQLDVWFHTGPIFLIFFLGIGTAAGFVNVYRIAAGPTTGPKRGAN
jgi:ATP synthase protein I